MENSKFIGTIPTFYDSYLAPIVMTPYAEDLAQRVVAVAPEGPILETACGTGVLTHQLRTKLLSTAKLVASDLNQPMLDIAKAKYAADFDVEWQQADATALPFPDRTFAGVVNQLGMMFMPDKGSAIREAARVLKGGGIFAFNVWDRVEENPYVEICRKAVEPLLGPDPSGFYMVPFNFYDVDMWVNLLSNNGFTQIEVHKVPQELRCERAKTLATGIIRGTPLSAVLDERNVPHDRAIKAATQSLVAEGGDQPFVSRMQAIVVTARTL